MTIEVIKNTTTFTVAPSSGVPYADAPLTSHSFIDKRNASRCVLSDIQYAVVLSTFLGFLSICSLTDISAEVPPIGVKVCVSVEDLSSGQKFSSFGGLVFRRHQMRDKQEVKVI